MVFDRIKKVVCEQLGVSEEDVKLETTFEALGADSLDLFQVVIELEEEFDIQLEDAENMKSIQDAVTYVNSKIA
ncbi:acyl carrier protein [Clostridium gasigenes]|uniref:Acyl carrier protein n=1 Tax=Clostridium gasigenes TaxID=94869 RepID=A0A1H0RH96_9CLOT|nr:acyl carrier protein [Clostridium gasigenes]MBB6623077.1 acyl carrier protein [Clostridium gasigenes]MBB6715205.1 acyl carrier protein [Clostridium gasigenes]MBU3087847.1 acyl carrier protein [Clostridium gasigenes]MBU3104156.1 acyl carrier protein [Clostridium gasigenes]MBU3107284.1 acyl carrier protein [Clostridium gasigenes]